MTDPLTRALIAHCDSVFEGPNGDYRAVLESLAGVSASQALWKPAPSCNSIWQIVDHLTVSKEWLIEMLEKGEAAPPVWTEPAGDEAAWQEAIARLKDAHARLNATIARLSQDDLLKIADAKSNQTLLELILSPGPAHEAHHGGQIDYLRGLQGL